MVNICVGDVLAFNLWNFFVVILVVIGVGFVFKVI